MVYSLVSRRCPAGTLRRPLLYACGDVSALQDARDAYAARSWSRARTLFEGALTAGDDLTGDDLYQLSDAVWWEGDNERTLLWGEAAYRRYVDESNWRRAAMAATDMALVHFLRGDETVGSGWISRAQRHLKGEDEAAEHGWLIYLLDVEGALDGVITPNEEASYASILDASRRVQELGRRHGDRTLEAVGILGEGRVLVKVGRVRDGLALLDEALLAALSDELNPVWAGNIYCHLMAAAHELAEVRRARDWTEATTRWLDALPAAVTYRGICRVHRSQVHQLAGDWDSAEEEARRVCEELAGSHRSATAEAHYQVGEIRRLRGDIESAGDAYERAHLLGRDPQPGLALLRLAQARMRAAHASISSAVVGETRPLVRARLLAAQVDIALACREQSEAERACEELEGIAAAYRSSGLDVAARHARGSALLAAGRSQDALSVLRDACQRWTDLDAPYDCARVRVLLARTYRALGDEDAVRRELDAAERTFARLGAATDLDAVSELRRQTLPGGLSTREAEVLALVAAGKTNREIASVLVVSHKTVSRHLSNIFTKLGVRSRTAAAAFAFEHDLVQPADR